MLDVDCLIKLCDVELFIKLKSAKFVDLLLLLIELLSLLVLLFKPPPPPGITTPEFLAKCLSNVPSLSRLDIMFSWFTILESLLDGGREVALVELDDREDEEQAAKFSSDLGTVQNVVG